MSNPNHSKKIKKIDKALSVVDSALKSDYFRNKKNPLFHSALSIISDNLNSVAHEYEIADNVQRYKDIGYIGSDAPTTRGKNIESRQKYFDLDKEFTDSVRSIAKRYNLRPNTLGTRIAEEGAIDYAIKAFNGIHPQYVGDDYGGGHWEDVLSHDIRDKGELISQKRKYNMFGPQWGLDRLGERLNDNEIKFTTSAPFQYEDFDFENEHGENTLSIYSPNWWMGIEGTAAELDRSKKAVKKRYPNMSGDDLEAAMAYHFNHGNAIGLQNGIPKEYYPYIDIEKKKKFGGKVRHLDEI